MAKRVASASMLMLLRTLAVAPRRAMMLLRLRRVAAPLRVIDMGVLAGNRFPSEGWFEYGRKHYRKHCPGETANEAAHCTGH